jgi:recombination protein RecR
VLLPPVVDRLIAELAKLPGIGRRSAERIAFDLVARSPDRPTALATVLMGMAESVRPCPECHLLTEGGRCSVCSDPARDRATLCVVETYADAIAFDRAVSGKPLFHVLGGRLSPLKGVTPSDLCVDQLLSRLDGSVRELILATSPSIEGDATAHYIAQEAAGRVARISRIGRGVPTGGSLEHADSETLRFSVESRRPFDG